VVVAVDVVVDGEVVSTAYSAPYQFNVSVPVGVISLILGAEAIDLGSNIGVAEDVVVNVIPDPLTTVIGTVIDEEGSPVGGASLTLNITDATTTSAADGTFEIVGLPTVLGSIEVLATATVDGEELRGRSPPTPPTPAGITDVGDIILRGGARVLLLADVDIPGTTALADALTAAGHEVTRRPAPENTWDGTDPPLTDFDVVVHLNGATFSFPLPVSAQTALVDFVRNGGGFVGSQWNGFELVQGRQTAMRDLILQLWPNPDNCGGCNMTWTVVPIQENHPVLEGVPDSFTFFADGHAAGSLVEFAEDPSAVLMRSPGGGPAVLVREFGDGRVVNFSSAANYLSQGLTLRDPNIQRLYINAVTWGSKQ